MAKKVKEVSPVTESDFNFFTEVDMNQYGNVGSYIPSYMNLSLVDDLRREISEQENTLNRQSLDPERRSQISKDLERKKERLDQIENHMPNLDKDKVSKMSKDIGKLITESMFSVSDMKKGLADAHEEARRMSEKCIPVSAEMANFLKGCNIKVDSSDMRVSRTQLEKAWKIGNRYLGEGSNVERLRREK